MKEWEMEKFKKNLEEGKEEAPEVEDVSGWARSEVKWKFDDEKKEDEKKEDNSFARGPPKF